MHVQYVRYKYFVGFSFNRYAYCMYNPLKYTDPTGERCFRWCETSYYIWQKAMKTFYIFAAILTPFKI